MQKQLNELYKTVFTPEKLATLKDKEKLSAPLLIKVFDSYINSDIKIMFVGKETNHWLTKVNDKNKKGVNYLLNYYDEAFEHLFRRYEKAFENNENSHKSAFFSQYMNIRDQLMNAEFGSIVWNNIYKLSYDQNKGFSKSAKNHPDIPELSKKIFLEELNILQPDILIFVTGASYDTEIKNYLEEYKTIDVPIKKRLWKFSYQLNNKNILCYRTIHPHYYRRNHKNEKYDYYQVIIDDIKNKNTGKIVAL